LGMGSWAWVVGMGIWRHEWMWRHQNVGQGSI